MATSMWLDIVPLLPSVLSPEDGNIILKKVLEQREKVHHGKKFLIFADTVLISPDLLDKIESSFDDLMKDQAKKDTESKKYEKLFTKGLEDRLDLDSEKSDKKDDRRKKAAAGKAGGGAQGRETKTKSTKKKYGKNKNKDDWEDSDDETNDTSKSVKSKKGGQGDNMKIEYLTREELEKKISQISLLQECPEELFSELSDHFYLKLTKKFKDIVTDLYQSSISASIQGKKKSHSDLQEKCTAAISHIRLFEKGCSIFEGNDKKSLEKHLLKTLCTDLVNCLFAFVHEGNSDEKTLNAEKRLKILGEIPKEEATALLAIHKALNLEEVSEFLDVFEEHAPKACDIFIRKADKKKDRQLVFSHRMSLVEQLDSCQDPPLLLHLVVMLVFQAQYNAILHASGKFVPQIIQKVVSSLNEEEGDLLKNYQSLVMESITADEERKTQISSDLFNLEKKVKDLALKKKSKSED